MFGFCEDEVRGQPGEWDGSIFLAVRSVEEPRLRMIATLAAPATDHKRFATYFPGDKIDLDRARKDAEKFCAPEEIDAFVEEMLEESRWFVDASDNWERIERIAHRLMARVAKAVKETPYPREVQVCGDELQEWFDGKGPSDSPQGFLPVGGRPFT